MAPFRPVTRYRSPWSWVRSTIVSWRNPAGTVVVVVVGGAVVVVVGAAVVVVVGGRVVVVVGGRVVVGAAARRVRRTAVVVVAIDCCAAGFGAGAVWPAAPRQATITLT